MDAQEREFRKQVSAVIDTLVDVCDDDDMREPLSILGACVSRYFRCWPDPAERRQQFEGWVDVLRSALETAH